MKVVACSEEVCRGVWDGAGGGSGFGGDEAGLAAESAGAASGVAAGLVPAPMALGPKGKIGFEKLADALKQFVHDPSTLHIDGTYKVNE